MATRKIRFWSLPVVISLALLAALAALYLGGILNPATNLRHFPLAVVNEDTGPVGAQVTDGLVAGIDKNKFDVRVLSASDAEHQLDTAQAYGQLLIPRDFSQQLQAFAENATRPGAQATRPVITVVVNPRAGTLGSSIATQPLTQAAEAANQKIGQQLSAKGAQQSGGAPTAGGVALALAHPVDVKASPHHLLPNGTGNGLSAFYYSLLLLLAGFTGSLVPPFFVWLARFEPMHQVVLGTRALLYFDGRADAALSVALVMCVIGLAIGLVIGVAATVLYDREGFYRVASPVPEAEKV